MGIWLCSYFLPGTANKGHMCGERSKKRKQKITYPVFAPRGTTILTKPSVAATETNNWVRTLAGIQPKKTLDLPLCITGNFGHIFVFIFTSNLCNGLQQLPGNQEHKSKISEKQQQHAKVWSNDIHRYTWARWWTAIKNLMRVLAFVGSMNLEFPIWEEI